MVVQIQDEIHNLRSLITQLRPAALDELGVNAAIEGLVDRLGDDGPDIEATVDLAYEAGHHSTRHEPELEAAIYRLVQEALNNAISHAGASTVRLDVSEDDETVTIVISDDGTGFDPAEPSEGFGLLGMRERVELAGGSLAIESVAGAGTTVRATLPAKHRAAGS